MSKFKGKLARRIMAIVLSGAMVMSNMSAYAAELSPETVTEVVSEAEETASAEATAETAREESVSDAKEENAETEPSVVKSSENLSKEDVTDKVDTEETTTADIETETTNVEAETITEAMTESVENKNTEDEESETEEITVEEDNKDDAIAEGTYILNGDDIDSQYVNNTALSTAINVGTKDYFTINKNVSIEKDSSARKFTVGEKEISVNNRMKFGGNSTNDTRNIAFTISEGKTADIVVGARSSSGSADAQVQLCKADGTAVDETSTTVPQSTSTVVTWRNIEAGSYYIAGHKPTGITGNVNVYYVEVVETETGTTTPSDRGDWSAVTEPTIKSAALSEDKTKIEVTASGVVAPTGVGADKIEVDMYDTNTIDENTTPIATKSSSRATEADENGDHLTTFEFTPEASGSYYFIARLVRADEKDEEGNVTTEYKDKESSITQNSVEFKLPLTKPVISMAKFTEKDADGKGIVSVSWGAVKDADYYVISAEYTDDANKETKIENVKYTPKTEEADAKSFSETLTVNMDSVVNVSVQAFRNSYNDTESSANTPKIDYSEISETKEVKVTEDEDRVYIDILQDTVIVKEGDAEVEKPGLKAGKAYGDDNVMTLEILEDMPQKNGESQPIYIQGSVNPDPKDGKIPTKGAVFKINPVKSVEITFDLFANGEKTYWLVNESGKYDKVTGKITGTSQAPTTPTLNFELHAGETYYFYVQASKAMVTGISYKKWTTDIDILQDTVIVKEGDTEVEKPGLKAGKAYGDDNVMTLEILEDMPQKNGESQPIYIQGSVNPDPKDGKIPTKGAVFKINPVKSVEITFDLFANGEKTYWLVNESGKYDKVTGKITGTSQVPTTPSLSFELHAGETYYFYVQASKAMVTGISYAEWYSGEEGPSTRGDWESVAAPEIVSIVQKDGSIEVKVKGIIDKLGAGGDYIRVERFNASWFDFDENPEAYTDSSDKITGADGKEQTIYLKYIEKSDNTTAGEDGGHYTTFVFTPSESGTFVFRATLGRKDETVKDENGNETIVKYEAKTSTLSEGYVFKLKLEPPVVSTLKNLDADENGNGVISIAWNKVTEAEYYSVLVADESGNVIASVEQIEGTSLDVSGLPISSTVAVTVKAFRDNEGEGAAPDESEWSAAKTITITGKEPNTYRIDAAELKVGDKPTAGTKLGTKNYFNVMLNSALAGTAEVKNASTGNFVEINKYGSAGFTFTVYGTADATFTVASTGGSNDSAFGLVNSEGKLVQGTITGAGSSSQESKIYESDTEIKGTAYIAHGTTTSTIDYVNLPAGTYTFLSPYAGLNRGGRVHSIVVYDSADMTERGAWDAVAAPVISEISYAKGDATISITASGYIAYDGADSLKVDMIGSDGNVAETLIKAADSIKNEDGTFTHVSQEFVFTPKASDNYSFRASLVRSGSDDIVMTESSSDWTVKDFVLPLATPSVGSMTNVAQGADKGGLEVIFTGVDEADYYVVAAFSNKNFNKDNSYVDIQVVTDDKLSSETDEEQKYTVVLKDMPLGECYITVQAYRNADNKLNQTAGLTVISRDAEGKITTNVTAGTEAETILNWKIEKLKASTGETDAEKLKSQAQKWFAGVAATESGFATAVVRSQASNGREKYINGKNDTRWFHSVYGSNTSRGTYTRAAGLNTFDGAYTEADDEYDKDKGTATVPANGYKERVFEEGDNKGDLKSVELWSENGRGKVVPASTDGFSYYYTSVDPSKNNFKLSALIHVMSWQYSNGQDGFGMMVSDTVGKDNDDGAAWTNAYQLLASKIQYSWYRAGYTEDGNGYVTNAGGNGTSIMRYEMKLGVGWNSKEGATAADVAKINSGALTAPINFVTDSGTLETSAGNNDLYTGSYNVIGNGYNKTAIPTSSEPDESNLLTDVRFQIQKYDNAYVLRYLKVDAAPELTDEEKASGRYAEMNNTWYEILDEQVFSDDNNNKLTQIDKQNIYVGFFAARYARVDISQIDMDVTEAGADDFPIPTTYIDPTASFSSEETSNSKYYDLVFSANFDGTLAIYKEDDTNAKEAVVTGKEITAGAKYTFTNELQEGKTRFTYYAKPNTNYVPGDNQELKNFNMQTNEGDPFPVTYHAFSGDEIYVAPNGDPVGTSYTVMENDAEVTYYAGCSAAYPTNVYDAVNYAAAGQTIYLAGGMYNLTEDPNHSEGGAAENILIGKGHDGTSRKNIRMVAQEGATERPVLNFGQSTIKNDTAFIMAGNYWYFEGFDVMGSRDGQKGILLGGSYNILNDIRTYLNGNTGVQVARYSNYGREDWPSYNTILNCSSFMNYDAGYEDADGYAAKLTCGDGNKFIGCISAYNADDGWDLFAKVESGSIGVVTIDNCLAFKNGYLFGVEDYYGSGQDLIYRYTDFSKYTKNTPVVNAGNGNGFKMGGDSMSGYHVLRNSVAFANKSKGIDSNSCPDIQVYNSISFNNEANNVAMYTGGAVNTDYYAENLVSIKDSNAASGYSTAENFDLRGTQNRNKVYAATNYYWNGSKSVNGNGDAFNLLWFNHTNITTAIFGKAQNKNGTRITRSEDGSIVMNGFLEYTEDGLKALNLQNSVIGTTPKDDVLDTIIDIYVFAADYNKGTSTLKDIDLKSFEATKKLAEGEGEGDARKEGYNWAEPDTLIAAYAGTTAEFTISAEGRQDRTVAVSFIQLDGAELQVVSGDTNGNEVLDYDEAWAIEAVPVISPAVEPDVKMSGFSAAIVDGSKGLLTAGTAVTGTVNPNLGVTAAQNTFTGSGLNGDAKLTATVSLDAGGKSVKKTAALTFAVNNGTGIKFDSINPADDSIVKWDSNTDSDYIQIAMDKTNEFTLNNLHFVKLNENKEQIADDFGKGVKISVNDTSVIKLKSTASSANGVDATFTIVNKSQDGGTATVTVTSKADKSLVRNYIVTISGSEFAWTAGTVEIDKAKTAGLQITALAPFGRTMDDVADDSVTTNEDGSNKEFRGITVKEVYKGTNALGKTVAYNDYFEAKQVTGSVYELNTTESAVASLPKGTYTVVYQAEVPRTVTTENEDGTTSTVTDGTEKVSFTPVTIKVTETRPAVTFKQSKKVNLFYNNGTVGSTGILTATSKQGVVTVEAGSSDYFRFSNNGAGYDIVSIKKNPVSLTTSGAADYKDVKQNSKVTLTAHVEGYYAQYDIVKPFTVALEYRQPKLKLTALDKTIYTAIGMDSADVLIYDPDSEMYLNTDVATIELVTDPAAKKAYSKANADFTVGEITSNAFSGNGVKLTVNSNTVKGGAVRLSISYDDWFSQDPVIVNQSIKVSDKVPKLTIKPAKLNMNTEKFVGKEQVASQILLNGTAGFTISDVELTGANSKAADFLKFVDYEVITDTNGNTVLLVSLKANADDGTAFPAAADSKGIYKMNSGYANSYSFTANYKLGSVEQTANFKLSLVSKEAVTVSTKGSINIVDRANSTVILKPKAQNFTASQIANVTLTGDSANQFEIVEFDKSTGATTIRAKETANLKKGSYKLLPVFTYDLGVSGTCAMAPIKPVVIKTTQPALKISGLKDALEVKLSSPNTAAKRTITVGSPAGAYITGMTQTSGLSNFTLSYDAGGSNVIVTIKNRAGLKEGTTYKITATLTVEGSGSNVKQQVVTIPVKVIR